MPGIMEGSEQVRQKPVRPRSQLAQKPLHSFFHGVDGFADFYDFAKVFVAEDLSLFYVGAAFVHVEVGAADVGGGEFDDDVGLLLYFGVGD
jgi:hypothetical protein